MNEGVGLQGKGSGGNEADVGIGAKMRRGRLWWRRQLWRNPQEKVERWMA